MWSGGCDSTALLYKLLNSDDKFRTLSIDHCQISEEQRAMEYQSRDKILQWAKDNYKIDVTNTVIKIENKGPHDYGISTNGNPQLLMMTQLGLLYIDIDDKLWLGIIKGDDSIRNLYNINKIARQVNYIRTDSDKIEPIIETPLCYTSKAEILKEMPEDLLKLTWWCESPTKNNRKCSKCPSCIRHNMSLYEMNEYCKKNEYNKKNQSKKTIK